MYTLALRRDFIARHYLTGGDWGAENKPHSHHYVLELQLGGENLNQHGYLVDLLEVEKHLDEMTARHREQMLNDLPAFAGLNPSIEHFSRILCTALNERIQADNIKQVKVVLWENEYAWVAYKIKR